MSDTLYSKLGMKLLYNEPKRGDKKCFNERKKN